MALDNKYYLTHYLASDSPNFSGLFDSIIRGVNAGLNVFQQLGGAGIFGNSSTGGACGQTQARGSAQIQQCSTQVLAAMDALLHQVGQQPYQQIVDAATQLANTLSNPQYFYQARHGDDANILNNAKQQAQQKLQQIIAAANAAANNPVGTVTGQTGQVISSGGNTLTTGLDSISGILANPLVQYAAIGTIIYVFIKRSTK